MTQLMRRAVYIPIISADKLDGEVAALVLVELGNWKINKMRAVRVCPSSDEVKTVCGHICHAHKIVGDVVGICRRARFEAFNLELPFVARGCSPAWRVGYEFRRNVVWNHASVSKLSAKSVSDDPFLADAAAGDYRPAIGGPAVDFVAATNMSLFCFYLGSDYYGNPIRISPDGKLTAGAVQGSALPGYVSKR